MEWMCWHGDFILQAGSDWQSVTLSSWYIVWKRWRVYVCNDLKNCYYNRCFCYLSTWKRIKLYSTEEFCSSQSFIRYSSCSINGMSLAQNDWTDPGFVKALHKRPYGTDGRWLISTHKIESAPTIFAPFVVIVVSKESFSLREQCKNDHL